MKFRARHAVPLASLIAIAASGCSSLGTENVLFVTKTSLGIDVDTKPPTFDVGFDRKEGTVAPVLGNGEVLPVMASFANDAGIVKQAIGQSFATGQAAALMSQYLGSLAGPEVDSVISDEAINAVSYIPDVAPRKRYFFGTDTSFGFRVNFGIETGGYPDSASLGYKRKELAYIPLVPLVDDDNQNVLTLPSLVATVGMNTVTTTPGKSKLVYSQFFGTGTAANYLAAQPGVRAAITTRILPESKSQNEGVIFELRKRSKEWTSEEKQIRLDLVLDGINALPDDKAFELSKNPPVADADIEALLNIRDETCLRLVDRDCDGDGEPDAEGPADPDMARETLRVRAVEGAYRSEEALAAWEAAVKPLTTGK